MRGSILLVNPWIYDFAAYNCWCEPLGLLWIAAVLREAGYSVRLLDCLYGSTERNGSYGTGKFLKTRLPKPLALLDVPRYYGRYGISPHVFDETLLSLSRPDLILVTSGMTYWYPGVCEVIRRVRRKWPVVPVVLGGTYATLCSEHASRYSGADYIVRGEAEWNGISIVERCLNEGPGFSHDPGQEGQIITTGPDKGNSMDSLPIPAHDLRWSDASLITRSVSTLQHMGYIGIETSRGCPYRCTYCASSLLHPLFMRRSAEHILEEITWYARRYTVRNFVFYDDALLFQPDLHILPLLDEIIAHDLDCMFHTPNGVHARDIDIRLARMMRQAGFRTVRLSLETSDPDRQRKTGGKITNEHFVHAVDGLKAAGFTARELGAYILVGLPGQTLAEMVESVYFVHRCGIQVKIAQYSPLPGTEEWQGAVEEKGSMIEEEPLLSNNTVFPSIRKRYTWKEIEDIKILANRLNSQLT